MKDNGIIHETPVFCHEQLLCCVVEKPSFTLALKAVDFGSDETCYGHVLCRFCCRGRDRVRGVYGFCAAFAVIHWIFQTCW